MAPHETVAREIVEQIDNLFALDRMARERGCDLAARHQLRVEHAPKLLGTILEKLEAAQRHALPASKLGKSIFSSKDEPERRRE